MDEAVVGECHEIMPFACSGLQRNLSATHGTITQQVDSQACWLHLGLRLLKA